MNGIDLEYLCYLDFKENLPIWVVFTYFPEKKNGTYISFLYLLLVVYLDVTCRSNLTMLLRGNGNLVVFY